MLSLFDEKEAFIQKLYEEYAPMLERMCVKKAGSVDSAYRDLIDTSIQNTFFIADRAYDILVQHPNVEAWLKKVCLNRFIPYKKRLDEKKGRTVPLETVDYRQSINMPDVSEEVINEIASEEMIAKIMPRLSKEERKVFLQRHIENESIEAIAKARNGSIASVKMMLSRIRKKAKEIGGKDNSDFIIIFVTISLLRYFIK